MKYTVVVVLNGLTWVVYEGEDKSIAVSIAGAYASSGKAVKISEFDEEGK